MNEKEQTSTLKLKGGQDTSDNKNFQEFNDDFLSYDIQDNNPMGKDFWDVEGNHIHSGMEISSGLLLMKTGWVLFAAADQMKR